MLNYKLWNEQQKGIHPPEKKNKQGGFDPQTPEQKAKWKKVDLITLPVEGTNCGNCKFVAQTEDGTGFCTNHEVLDYVNKHMCCSLWDNKGVVRKF